MRFSQLFAAGALFAGSFALPQQSTTTEDSSSGTACNNSPSLCNKNYNAITHLGAHNSAFLRDDSTNDSIAGNQYFNATRALDAGLRLLQAQLHVENGELRLCHTTCQLMDAGLLQDWLETIREWMDDHKNDVVTILIVNSDDASTSDIAAAFEGSGIGSYGYTPSSSSATGDWPTLQSMIDQNTRLVSFVANIDPSPLHSYLLSEFTYVFETPFEVTQLNGFNCTADRPSNLDATSAISSNFLSLVNHFKYQTLAGTIQVPDVDTINIVNNAGTSEQGNLGLHLQQCRKEWGGVPNFVLIDFWSEENPLEAADTMNDVSGATGREAQDSAVEAGASEMSRSMGVGALVAFISAAILLI